MLWCLDTVFPLTAPPCNNGLVGIDPFADPGVNWFPGGLGAKFGFPKFGTGFDEAEALSNRFNSLTDPDVCASSCGVLVVVELPIELALALG